MPITTEFIGYIAAAIGALSLVWFRIESLVKVSRREMQEDMIALEKEHRELAATFQQYQTHVAETYASKQGLKEQMAPLFEAVKDVSGQVRHISERIDRVIDSRPASARRSSAS